MGTICYFNNHAQRTNNPNKTSFQFQAQPNVGQGIGSHVNELIILLIKLWEKGLIVLIFKPVTLR